MGQVETRVAMIVDLVGSRRHHDRAWVHKTLLDALDAVNVAVKADQPLAPTVGDEAQARYMTVQAAISASLLLRLALPEGLDSRCGIGVGPVQHLGTGVVGLLQDGPGWWAARDAIIEAKAREGARDRTLRTWYMVADSPDVRVSSFLPAELVNAYLLMRDEIVSRMPIRSRRLLSGLLRGQSQAEMAATEGVSASAVSQNLRRSGAFAILHAHQSLVGQRLSVAGNAGKKEKWE